MHITTQCTTLFPNFLNLPHAKLLFTFISVSIICYIYLFLFNKFSSESKLRSVIGFLLMSIICKVFELAISSNRLRAPESLISQFDNLISSRFSQKFMAAATHLAPLLPMGESDISIYFSLFSMTPFK